jgi:predicted SprT family Zn-dependent metalloprotease
LRNRWWNMAITQVLRTQNKVHATEVIADGATHFMESFKAISVRESRALAGPNGASKRSRGKDVLVQSTRRAISHGVLSGELARTIERWAELWRVVGLRDRVTVHFNARLRTTIARWVIESNRLEISSRFFELRRDQRQILCHEFAHAAAVMKYGRAVRPHGPEWCHFVRVAGFEPVTHLVFRQAGRATSKAARPLPVYEHRCVVCQAIRYARKPVTNWRCVECVGAGLDGALDIRTVPHARVTR